MAPEFQPGDRLLVDLASYRGASPSRGDVVVLRDPEDRRRLLLKRIAAMSMEPVPVPGPPGDDVTVPDRHVYVLSDSPRGRDSRRFGSVPLHDLLGPVWFRYAPPGRRGPIPG